MKIISILGKCALSLVQILSFGTIVMWLGQYCLGISQVGISFILPIILPFLFLFYFLVPSEHSKTFHLYDLVSIAETVGFIFSSQWGGKAIPNWKPDQIGGPNNLGQIFSSLKRSQQCSLRQHIYWRDPNRYSAFLLVGRMMQFEERMYTHSPSENIAYI